jgi:hypothetical protein
MPASVELCENGRILHYVFTDPWTLAEMDAAAAKAIEYYDKADRKLYVLLDARRMRNVPPGVLRAARTNPDIRHRNSGQIAIVSAAKLVEVMGQTIMRLTHSSKAKFFPEEQAAWVYLRELIAKEDMGIEVTR